MKLELIMNRDLALYNGKMTYVQEIAGVRYLRPVEGFTDIGAGTGEMIQLTQNVADQISQTYRALTQP